MSIADVTHTSGTRTGALADRNALRLSAVLLVSSFVVLVIATVFHPGGADPNDHPATFTQYAHSAGWTADHLVQFIGGAIGIAGLIVLFYALNLPDGMPRLAARIGVVSAGAALAISAIELAVDGVVLKRAVDAWVSAPDADKAARFASAEAVRWLEEATTSYLGFVLGFTLVLLAALIVWTALVPRPIGYLLALSGAGYLVVGWMVGVSGFAPERAIPTYVAVFSQPIAGVWLLISAWRMPASGEIAPQSGSPARGHDAGAAARSR